MSVYTFRVEEQSNQFFELWEEFTAMHHNNEDLRDDINDFFNVIFEDGIDDDIFLAERYRSWKCEMQPFEDLTTNAIAICVIFYNE